MKLKDYFEERCINLRKWCKKYGFSQTTLYMYQVKRKMPSITMAKRISAATGGQVTLEDLIAYAEEKNG